MDIIQTVLKVIIYGHGKPKEQSHGWNYCQVEKTFLKSKPRGEMQL